jgi:ABC-type Fe3+-hydroxamate transport system substrate-binding protein
VVTHFALTMTTLDLGLTPAGTAAWVPANVTTEYANTLADVPVVTSQAGDPELEQIAAQSPDLILATSYSDEQLLGQLREIAPTFVVTISAGGANATSWSDRTKEIADVLGRTLEYDKLASDFEARKQQIMQTMPSRSTAPWSRSSRGSRTTTRRCSPRGRVSARF